MGKAVPLAIDHQFDVALRPAFDVLAEMGAGLAEAELAEQGGQILGLCLIDGEFDKTDAAGLRSRLQHLIAGWAWAQPVFQQNERSQSVGRRTHRRTGPKLVIEYFQGQRTAVTRCRD